MSRKQRLDQDQGLLRLLGSESLKQWPAAGRHLLRSFLSAIGTARHTEPPIGCGLRLAGDAGLNLDSLGADEAFCLPGQAVAARLEHIKSSGHAKDFETPPPLR